jgi:hypothetical protein
MFARFVLRRIIPSLWWQRDASRGAVPSMPHAAMTASEPGRYNCRIPMDHHGAIAWPLPA